MAAISSRPTRLRLLPKESPEDVETPKLAESPNLVELARTYAGITQTELGKRLGRSQTFVSNMESGEQPWDHLAQELHEATGLPITFFTGTASWEAPESAVSFRKRSNCPAVVRNRATFYAMTAHAIVEPLVSRYVKYPYPDVPAVPLTEVKSQDEAREVGAAAARVVRSKWEIGWGPISDVIRLLESKGVRVFYVREGAEHLDGFACWTGDKPYIFLNQLTDDPARVRLDAAHELAHLVMHREQALDARTDLYEAMAFGFAAEFLAPWETFKREAPIIPDLNRLAKLRPRWRMSMQAMVKHMYANEAISHAAYTNAFRRFNVLGYRRGPEPGWIVPDSSAIHAKFVEMVEAKGMSISSLAEEAGMSDKLLGEMIPASTALAFDF